MSCANDENSKFDFSQINNFVISFQEDELSENWAIYLSNHLEKRGIKKIKTQPDSEIYEEINSNRSFIVHLSVNPELANDYCISGNLNILNMTVKEQKTSIWMTYQFIEFLSAQLKEIVAEDLPPSLLNFENPDCADFDFSYREVYSPYNLQPEFSPLIGADNLENDWGIWGHNLSKIVKEAEIENKHIYAEVDGKIMKDQFSFTSPQLLTTVRKYIIENYGENHKEKHRFMIAPNDNDIVCLCHTCQKIGNTENNATPAVTYFLNQLAAFFPNYEFYTIAYRTTKEIPTVKMKKNTGVFISTIDLPKENKVNMTNQKIINFAQQVEEWKGKTDNVFLWDYNVNFDDYLTPLPILYSIQNHLKWYKKLDIKGIFFNGSGYDFSSFNEMKTYVTSALLMNVDENVPKLIASFFKKFYPENHQFLTDYYMQLENEFNKKNETINLYGGMEDIFNSYLNIPEFISFYERLKTIQTAKDSEEQKALKKLFVALSFTRMQIAYYQKTNEYGLADLNESQIVYRPEINDILFDLKKYTDYNDLYKYKEDEGFLEQYIKNWEDLPGKKIGKNDLLNKKITVLKPQKVEANPEILNDGVYGFPEDYHQGWFISNQNLEIEIPIKKLTGEKELTLRFLENKKHRFQAPDSIVVELDNGILKTIVNRNCTNEAKTITCRCDLDLTNVSKITLILKGITSRYLVGLDEIQIKNK